jgi:hypothetical protein
MKDQVEFVLIERDKMSRKTNARYYLGYGRTIPLGNQKAMKPSDLKVGMVMQGNFKQGVVIENIEIVTDNKGENHYKIKVGGQTAGGEYFEFSEYQTAIIDYIAIDLVKTNGL